jgi:hypothetical protein
LGALGADTVNAFALVSAGVLAAGGFVVGRRVGHSAGRFEALAWLNNEGAFQAYPYDREVC